MLFRVLTDIRYPFFFTDIRYPLSVIRYPTDSAFLSRNNKKKSRDKTFIKLVKDDKMFNFFKGAFNFYYLVVGGGSVTSFMGRFC